MDTSHLCQAQAGCLHGYFTLMSSTSWLLTWILHTYVKRKQAAYMDTLISKCDGENVVLQVDFFENATILVKMRHNQHTCAMVRQPFHSVCLDQGR